MTVRCGVVGAGMIGKDHSRRITQVLSGAEVVAVSDINKAGAQDLVDSLQLDARVFDDGHELIRADDVDAILVTSSNNTHEEYVLAAIEAGKCVFSEKPLAATADGCRRIVEAEVASGRQLVQVGYMRRYDSGYRKAQGESSNPVSSVRTADDPRSTPQPDHIRGVYNANGDLRHADPRAGRFALAAW